MNLFLPTLSSPRPVCGLCICVFHCFCVSVCLCLQLFLYIIMYLFLAVSTSFSASASVSTTVFVHIKIFPSVPIPDCTSFLEDYKSDGRNFLAAPINAMLRTITLLLLVLFID